MVGTKHIWLFYVITQLIHLISYDYKFICLVINYKKISKLGWVIFIITALLHRFFDNKSIAMENIDDELSSGDSMLGVELDSNGK